MKVINGYIEEHKLIYNKQFFYEDTDSASRRPKSSNIYDEKLFTRRGLNELITDSRLKKFDTIMVYTHDRFTRNVQESLVLKVLFDKLKIRVIYCKPGENVDTESEKMNIFFENLLNNLSELEANLIGSRTRLGNSFNIKKGYWAGGPPPYGYKLSKEYPGSRKSILKISYPEARVVKDIFNKYLQGFSPVKIAEYIKNEYKENIDRKWTKNTIISILKNEDYTGVIVWDKKGGVRNPVKHKTPISSPVYKENIIIEDEVWKQAENIRTLQKEHPKFFSSQFLLYGHLVCGKCGKIMKTKNNGIGKDSVYYCLKEKWEWETCVESKLIESNVIKKLGEHLTFLLSNDENFNLFYEKYIINFNSRKNVYDKSSAELQLQICDNNDYLTNCTLEIANLQDGLNNTEKDDYINSLNFIESLKELHSYLKINEDILNKSKIEVDKKIKIEFLKKEILKEFIFKKKNLLDTIESKLKDKDIYRRRLRLLLYDLVDKIIYKEDESIEIIIK